MHTKVSAVPQSAFVVWLGVAYTPMQIAFAMITASSVVEPHDAVPRQHKGCFDPSRECCDKSQHFLQGDSFNVN
eukprot:1145937-Amphidinium_carterae.1